MNKQEEYKRLNIWHVCKQIPFILPEQLKYMYKTKIESGTDEKGYFEKVLKNNARFHVLHEEIYGEKYDK